MPRFEPLQCSLEPRCPSTILHRLVPKAQASVFLRTQTLFHSFSVAAVLKKRSVFPELVLT